VGADPEQGRAVLDEAPGVGGMGLRPGNSSTHFGDRTLELPSTGLASLEIRYLRGMGHTDIGEG